MKLLLDEDASGNSLFAELDNLRFLNLVKAKDCGLLGRGDDLIIKTAQQKQRIILTANIEDFNEEDTPPCTGHAGVIVFTTKSLKPENVIPRIKAFKALSYTDRIKGHVAKISEDYISLYTLQGEERENIKTNARTKRLFK